MTRPSTAFRNVAALIAPGQQWKRRLLNAFALVAVPASTALAGPADLPQAADEGVVSLGAADAEGSVRLGGVSPASHTALPPVDVGVTDNMPPLIEPVAPAYTDPLIPEGQAVGEATNADYLGYQVTQNPAEVLYSLGRTNLDYPGTNEGWTSLSALVPFADAGPDAFYFANPRMNITDRGRGAFNLGLGKRWYDAGLNRAYEASLWYDYDAGHFDDYHQLGFHTAAVARNVEFRLGGNVPLNKDGRVIGTPTFGTPFVRGTGLFVPTTTVQEWAYQQYYAEVATPLGALGGYGMTFGLGGYVLVNDDAPQEGVGVSARVESQINENLWVNVLVTSDPVSDFNTSLNFEWTLPDGAADLWFRKPCPKDYLRSTTRRNYRVFAEQIADTRDRAPLDKFGDAYTVAVIDPNVPTRDELLTEAAEAEIAAARRQNRGVRSVLTDVEDLFGDGSAEMPFGSTEEYMALSAAERADVDVIIVRPNALEDDAGAGLATPITLLDCQQITGSLTSICFNDFTPGLNPSFPDEPIEFTLPGLDGINFDPAGDNIVSLPLISNADMPGTPVITIAEGARDVGITGLRIDATDSASAIVGEDVRGYKIASNEIVRFRGDAVRINNSSPDGATRGVFYGNVIRGAAGAADTTLLDLGLTLQDVNFDTDGDGVTTVADFAGVTILRTPTEEEILQQIGISLTDPTLYRLDADGQFLRGPGGGRVPVTRTVDGEEVPILITDLNPDARTGTDADGNPRNVSLFDLGLSLADFGITLDDLPDSLADFAEAVPVAIETEEEALSLIALRGLPATTGLGTGAGRTGGFVLTHDGGEHDLLIAHNMVSGIGGEDANGNNVLDAGEGVDLNMNGVIDPAEGIDANGDGVLSLGELLDINGNGVVDFAGQTSAVDDAFDANGDGVVEFLEGVTLPAGVRARLTDLVARFDANGDGVLQRSEAVDVNGNGVLDAADGRDLNGDGRLAANERFDVNGDGFVSPGELLDLNGNGSISRAEAFDLNGDGVINLAEGTDLNGNGRLDLAEGTDLNGDGVITIGEDVNGNGILDPGRGISVTVVSGVVDADDPVPANNGLDLQDMKAATGIIDNMVGLTEGPADALTSVGGSGATFGIEVIALEDGKADLVFRDNKASGGVGFVPTVVDPGFLLDARGGMIRVDEFSGNQAIGAFQDGGQFLASGGGMLAFVDPANDPNVVAFRDNDFIANGRNGALFLADDGTIFLDGLTGNDFIGNGNANSGEGSGLVLQADNDGTVTITDPVSGNVFQDNVDAGVQQSTSTGGSISANFINLLTQNADGTFVVGEDGNPLGSTVLSGNGTGLRFNVGEGSTLVTGLDGVIARGGLGDGIVFDIDGGDVVLTTFTNVSADGNAGSGVVIDVTDGGTFTTPGISDSTFNNNGRAGLLITGDGSDGGDGLVNLGLVEDNQFNRAIQIVESDTGILVDDAGNITFPGPQVLFAEGSGLGVEISTTDVVTTATFVRNEFVGRRVFANLSLDLTGPDGDPDGVPDTRLNGDGQDPTAVAYEQVRPFVADLDGDGGFESIFGAPGNEPSSVVFGPMLDDDELELAPILSLATAPAGDIGPGIGGTVVGGGVNLQIGDPSTADNANLFDSNGLANIGFVFDGDSNNNVRVDNNVIRSAFGVGGTEASTGVLKAFANTPFGGAGGGDGIAYDVRGTSVLAGGIFGNKIVDNDGDGIDIRVGGVNETDGGLLLDFSIANNTVTGNGNPFRPGFFSLLDETTFEELDNGIQITQRGTGALDNLSITGNRVELNNNNGLVIDAAGPGLIGPVDVSGNSFSLNGYAAQTIDASDIALVRLFEDSRTDPNFNLADIIGEDASYAATLNDLAGFGVAPDGVVAPQTFLLTDNNPEDGVLETGPGAESFPDVDADDPIDQRVVVAADQTANGVLLVARGEAQLDVNLDQNRIAENADSGVSTTTVRLGADAGAVGGSWTRNEISMNLEDGIALDGGFANLTIGSVADPTLGNRIVDNFSDGIEITGDGDVIIANNLIAWNGQGAFFDEFGNVTTDFDEGGDYNNTAGIDINLDTNSLSASIVENTIIENIGDGIEFVNGTSGSSVLNITDNRIAQNTGRGFDVLLLSDGTNALDGGSSILQVEFLNNTVSGNGLQGVVVTGTNDAQQDQSGRLGAAFFQSSTAGGLGTAGNVLDQYFLRFDMRGNEITDNGSAIPGFFEIGDGVQNTGGVVFRVGTTGGGYGPGEDGGYATLDSGFLFNPGMEVTMLDNTMANNFGADLFIASYTTTVPAGTGTAWETAVDDQTFNPTGYQGDPLARFDLTYFNNIVGAADVVNEGAFYNDADGEFKSRTRDPGGDFPATVRGPFTVASRHRNAQRLADREYPNGFREFPPAFISLDDEALPAGGGPGFLNSGVNQEAGFLFPGLGDSTFRVNLSVAGATPEEVFAELVGDGFFAGDFDDNPTFDPSPIESPGERNGELRGTGGLGENGETPYGWGTYFTDNGLPN